MTYPNHSQSDKESQNRLEAFIHAIVKGIKPLDGDTSKFVDDNFWDLI